MRQPFTRRAALRSATAMVALPVLESLGLRRSAAAAPAAAPRRIVFIGTGWGVTEETWYPDRGQTGPGYALPPGLKPLERHKADFTIVQGLWNRQSNDGHTGSAYWLTGANRYARPGMNMFNTISVDQVAARELGGETRFASLTLASNSDGPALDGHGGPMSWDSRGKPLPGMQNPVQVYHKLFSGDAVPLEQRQAMLADRRSVLDSLVESADELGRRLGAADKAVLEQYLEGIRDIENRLAKEEKWLGVPTARAPFPKPFRDPDARKEIKLMYDLMAAAFEVDLTRSCTYMLPNSTLLKSLQIDLSGHEMSHYGQGIQARRDASQRRDLVNGELLAGFLDALKAKQGPDGSRLFDHTTVVFGSNIRTAHALDNCPTLIAGGGAGITLGQHVVLPDKTPLCNAWLTLLRGMGLKVEAHGDSTGALEQLLA